MAALRPVLAGLLVASAMVLLAPATSYACSCVGGRIGDLIDRSDAVFTGTLVEVTPSPERPVMSSVDPTTYTFETDTVHQGDVSERAVVTSASSGASCGLEGMRVGTSYVVFATGAPDRLEADLCGGTAASSAPLTDRVDRALGSGHPPDADPFGRIVALLLELLGWG